jgi:hypothetical protein
VQSFRFRVAIQDQKISQWKRLGAEANTPLRAVVAPGTPRVPQRGFFEISDARVHMLAFKQAESRPDLYVIRLQESSGERVSGVSLKSSLKIGIVQAANLVEEPLGGAVDLAQLSFEPWQTRTILVRVEP